MAKILVADDDADICDLLDFKLASVGHQVVVASDGAQALNRVTAATFDLLLLDCMMPHYTGQEVLESVRSDERMRQVPVILMSAHANADVVEHGRALGADAFVTKPFSLAALCADIDALLLGSAVVTE